MKLIIEKNYEQLSKKAAEIIAEEIRKKPNLVMCLPTGSTPVGTYKKLAEMVEKKEISFNRATTFNLDEYVGLKPDDINSYHYFMKTNLFDHIDAKEENINIPNGCADNMEEECRRYNAKLDMFPCKDLLLSGIGQNGHIGFNEPADELYCRTHTVKLSDNTIAANSRFFDNDINKVPKAAVTMGIADIMHFNKIIVVANGPKKAQIIKKMMTSAMASTHNTSSLLNLHNDVIVIVDEEAASLL